MSHIVKGRVNVAYTNKDLLIKALQEAGTVTENDQLYRVGAGYTREKYDLVLADRNDKSKRIGYKLEDGAYRQYQEDYGSYGNWTQSMSSRIEDNYLAFHYEQQLMDEGYSVSMKRVANGGVELVAEEMVW